MTDILSSLVFAVGCATISARLYKSTEQSIEEDVYRIKFDETVIKANTYDLETALSVFYIIAISIAKYNELV